MAQAKEETAKKERIPQAKKRELQSKRQRQVNKSFRSKVNSAITAFNTSVAQGNPEAIKEKLSQAFSLMDKGVKIGTFKLNKASRVKSKLVQSARAKA